MRGQQDGVGRGPLRQLIALLAALSIVVAVPAGAAERTVAIASFDRLRVEGPFVVTVAQGPPRVQLSGDARAVERVAVEVQGRTLVIRRGPGGWRERGDGVSEVPVTVALSTPVLAAVASSLGARITAARLSGDRVETTLAGAGTIAVGAIDARQLVAQVGGAGELTLAGRVATARLLNNGGGAIVADALDTGDLFAWVDGAGTATARARYTARVTVTAGGRVTVAGRPKCFVQPAGADGVRCGVE